MKFLLVLGAQVLAKATLCTLSLRILMMQCRCSSSLSWRASLLPTSCSGNIERQMFDGLSRPDKAKKLRFGSAVSARFGTERVAG